MAQVTQLVSLLALGKALNAFGSAQPKSWKQNDRLDMTDKLMLGACSVGTIHRSYLKDKAEKRLF